MKREVKGVIIFVSGLLLGGGIGVLASKTYFERRANREVEDVKRAFGDRLDEIISEHGIEIDKAKFEGLTEGAEYRKKDADAPQIPIGMDKIIENLGKGPKVDYRQYYKGGKTSVNKLENAHPTDGEISESVAGVGDSVGDSYGHGSALGEKESASDVLHGEDGSTEYPDGDVVHPIRDKGRVKPRIIKEEDYGDVVGYDYKELYFYSEDGVLIDADADEIIDDPVFYLGDALTKYGFSSSTEERLYVRNDNISCDFEVIKIFGKYAD